MPTFIETSYCRGRRPAGVAPLRHHYARSDLVARLLQDRHVARFLVAPTGFGKSATVFEYADVIFSFRHVFWIDGRSPCFLRDLDAESILPGILTLDARAKLVVLEDVPVLDDARAELFDLLVDQLLERGIEVIVTCVPSADVFALAQRDRVLLTASDLLLSDAAMALEEMGGRLRAGWQHGTGALDRVACVRWSDAGVRMLLDGAAAEQLPEDLRLSLLCLLVLEEGDVDDLAAVVPVERIEDIVAMLAAHYVFLGIDQRAGIYRVHGVDMIAIAASFGRRMDNMAASSLHEGRDELCGRLADLLVARGKYERACDLMAGLATRDAAARWLSRCGWHLLVRGGHEAALSLVQAIGRSVPRGGLSALRCWMQHALGDDVLLSVRRLASGTANTPQDRLRITLLHTRFAEGREQVRAHRELAALLEQAQRADVAALDDLRAGCALDWEALAAVAGAAGVRLLDGFAAWEAFATDAPYAAEHAETRRQALLLGAAWLLEDACACVEDPALDAQRTETAPEGEAHRAIGSLAARLGVMLSGALAADGASWPALRAARAWDAAGAAGVVGPSTLSAEEAGALRRFEMELVEQKETYRRKIEQRRRDEASFDREHPDVFRRPRRAKRPMAPLVDAPPLLFVSLFGGVSVRMGERAVDGVLVTRRKTRVLLAMLVLGRGREITRERLAAALWPESPEDFARRNFYSVWSQLRRVLQVGGSCPYLISSQAGCRLDAALVESDVYEFEELCRTLLFGKGDPAAWEDLYAQVVDRYAEDLVPGEDYNEVIADARDQFRLQLVDGLLAASGRLAATGETRGALWFAREALRRDRTREDAYVTLMEAQIASDQRGAALETYFSCRRYLSDQLGIDPSPHVVDLYRSIIECEHPLE